MSQVDFFNSITRIRSIDWAKVELFHLDEYVGLSMTHPGSLRKMISEYLIQRAGITNYHLIAGEANDPNTAAQAMGKKLTSGPIDVAFIGIGENAHVAFNDPPADFATEEPYIIVNLDEACRRQQVGEGWFTDLSEVPGQAISMSVRQILKAKELIVIVPEKRKAVAVKACFEGQISPNAPGSILRTHPSATIYLDKDSASLLMPDLQKIGTHELLIS